MFSLSIFILCWHSHNVDVPPDNFRLLLQLLLQCYLLQFITYSTANSFWLTNKTKRRNPENGDNCAPVFNIEFCNPAVENGALIFCLGLVFSEHWSRVMPNIIDVSDLNNQHFKELSCLLEIYHHGDAYHVRFRTKDVNYDKKYKPLNLVYTSAIVSAKITLSYVPTRHTFKVIALFQTSDFLFE